MDTENLEQLEQATNEDSEATQEHYCAHIKMSGERCAAIAVKDSRYCYFHRRYKENLDPTAREYYYHAPLPPFEDPRSIVLACYDTIADMRRGNIDQKQCFTALYGISIASRYMTRPEARSPLDQRQLEDEARALLELKLKAKSKPAKEPVVKKDEKKDPEEEGPSLLRMFYETLQEMKRGEWRPAHLDEDELDLPAPTAPDPQEQPK